MPESDGKSQGGREDHGRQNGRARAVRQAARGIKKGAPYVVATEQGTVSIERVTHHRDEEQDLEWVEVFLGGQPEGGDPHFRLFNPPTLAEDPAGDIERNGRRYREDPLLAVAQVVALSGGAEPSRKMSGRRGLR